MFDINTAIGHWPFRQIPNQRIDRLRALLQCHGIEGAAAANTHALFYKNCHDANLELAEAIADHSDFFVGVATINPTYAAWERDLSECVEKLAFKALRLVPQYHDYALDSSEATAAVRIAASLDLPVLIPHRLVDIRQRHWMDTEAINAIHDVLALAQAVPEAAIVLTECRLNLSALTASPAARGCTNLYLETSRLSSAYDQMLAAMVRELGARRFLFGSGAPFKEIAPAVLKLVHADLSTDDREMVAQGSARTLLALPTG